MKIYNPISAKKDLFYSVNQSVEPLFSFLSFNKINNQIRNSAFAPQVIFLSDELLKLDFSVKP
jgi:hypothetical protein